MNNENSPKEFLKKINEKSLLIKKAKVLTRMDNNVKVVLFDFENETISVSLDESYLLEIIKNLYSKGQEPETDMITFSGSDT